MAMKREAKHDFKLILDIPSRQFNMNTDEIRLEQIMSNLINNAIKFTNEGYIKFGFEPIDNNVLFYVEDTGIGIKEEFQPEIFNKFVKNENTNEAKFARGTGIGLSLSRDLVQILGGKMWFSSTYHEGTTFYFTLPTKTTELGYNEVTLY